MRAFFLIALLALLVGLLLSWLETKQRRISDRRPRLFPCLRHALTRWFLGATAIMVTVVSITIVVGVCIAVGNAHPLYGYLACYTGITLVLSRAHKTLI